jgi:hypothetical protein
MKPQAKLGIVLLIVMYLVGLLQDINSESTPPQK